MFGTVPPHSIPAKKKIPARISREVAARRRRPNGTRGAFGLTARATPICPKSMIYLLVRELLYHTTAFPGREI
jgi:hypothetical protein